MIRDMIKKALGMDGRGEPTMAAASSTGGLAKPATGGQGGLVQMGRKPSARQREGLPHRPADVAVDQWLTEVIAANPVLIFMKGTPSAPMCGFSAKVVDIFKQSGAKFETYNILEDFEVREGIKAFNNWPTIPQIFVGGEFIGGCDIVVEMAGNGELAQALAEIQASASAS